MVILDTNYSKVGDLEEIVIHIDHDSLLVWIAALTALKEKIEECLLLKAGKRKFYLFLSDKESPFSTYKLKSGGYNLLLSENSMEYVHGFLLKIFTKRHAPVNHIHIDFFHTNNPEFSLTFLVVDKSMVRWEDENLE